MRPRPPRHPIASLAPLALLLALAASLSACAPGTVVVRGQELPVAEADKLVRGELAVEQAAAMKLPPAERAQKLEALAARYPGVPTSAELLHEAARAWRTAGDRPRAAAALSRLLVEHPLYPNATAAKQELALLDLEQGRLRDGLATLGSIYSRLPPSEQPATARAAALAAEVGRLWPEALRWWSELSARSSGAEQAEALARAVDVVDARLSTPELQKLRALLPADAPVLPIIAMKLTRVRLHERDYAGAEQEARALLTTWPDSSWAAEARALLERLGRLTAVKPGVIGVAVPLSGQFKRWGEVILQGVALAIPEGSGLTVVVRDTRGEPDGAAAAIEQLALDEQAILVLGGVSSGEAERAAATAEELAVPFISLSRQENVTDAGPHVFQNMLTASAQARALADLFMGKRGMKRFGLLYPSVPYGAELANAFWDEVEARGGEVRAAETYAIDRTTFTPLVKAMVGRLYADERPEFVEAAKEIVQKESDPFRRRKALEKLHDGLPPVIDFDAILVADFARNVKLIAPALAVEDVVTITCLPEELKRLEKNAEKNAEKSDKAADKNAPKRELQPVQPVQLLGGNGWGGDPSLFDSGPGGAGRHVRCAIYVDGFFAGSARPETRRFTEAYRKRYEVDPTILEASAHDAVKMARQVLEQDKAQTREALRDGLAALKGFKGATGDITFSPRRTPEKELFFLTTDRDGVRELTRAELNARSAVTGAP
jgi:ABC-type branched-subunit amino acid transport system substrate-binding protein